MKKNPSRPSLSDRIIERIKKAYAYFSSGVWSDPSDSFRVRLIKTANLSINSFMNKDLQSTSMSLTYVTTLAIVPMLAILLAFGRAFGLQNYLQDQVYKYFPAQHDVLVKAFDFVDSYLKQASGGVFVGVGIIILLWTAISLMSRIEDTFNAIWNIESRRTFFRKMIDYTAFMIFVPLLMLSSSGVSILVSTTLSQHLAFLSPLVNILIDVSPFLLVWIAFTFSFLLVPNTSVTFKYAVISGFVCGVAFQIIQFLFVNGQIYVAKYNAIYGSFAFLPLLLIWLQLSWLILLCGCMFTYAMQNVFGYNSTNSSVPFSRIYFEKVAAVVLAIIVRKFDNHQKAMTVNDMAKDYDLPVEVVTRCVHTFKRAGMIYYVDGEDKSPGVVPAFNPSELTLGDVLKAIESLGSANSIPRFDTNYAQALKFITPAIDKQFRAADTLLIRDIPVPTAGINPEKNP